MRVPVDVDMIRASFAEVGVGEGDVVFVYSDLSRIGPVAGTTSKESLCEAYLAALRSEIGETGTVVVPTYTPQVARYDQPFVLEETPTLMGVFPEYLRQRSDSMRSIHPINSVAAIGARKEEISEDNGTSNFGVDSPFDRLLQLEAKIVTIGVESGYVVGIAHHLECACALPYVYNKLLKWHPIVRGKEDERTFTATLRYLDLDVTYDLTAMVKHMRGKGGVHSARLGRGWVHCAKYKEVFEEGARLLRDNPYLFLRSHPTFTYGKLPFDGPTAGRDEVSRRGGEGVKKNSEGFYLMSRRYAGGDEGDLETAEGNT
jgi:aminoglycoside 3-N-acetyltransferase